MNSEADCPHAEGTSFKKKIIRQIMNGRRKCLLTGPILVKQIFLRAFNMSLRNNVCQTFALRKDSFI